MGSLFAAIGLGAKAAGQESGRATTIEGAESQARIGGQALDVGQEQFETAIERQQPFLDVGTAALPKFIESISNRGDVSDLPATQIQSSLISEFLGDDAPAFVTDKAMTNLKAVEAEKNKGRLADLVSIALGGTGAVAGSRVDLGTSGGQSISNIGNITGQSLQDAATARQGTANLITSGASGLPAFIAANRGGNTGVTNPNITTENPLGLTPGQGL